MMTPIKWVFTSLTIVILVLSIAYASSVQSVTTRTTAEAEALLETVNVGLIRSGLNEDGTMNGQLEYVDKEEIVTNLTASVLAAQKSHPYDIKLDYVFLDDTGKITTNEKEIRGIQFRVELLDSKGNVKGSAERRLSLNQLKT